MPKKKIKHHKKVPYLTHKRITFTILATVGVVAVWRGIWVAFDALPYFDKPIVAITVALVILILGGIYFKKIDFF